MKTFKSILASSLVLTAPINLFLSPKYLHAQERLTTNTDECSDSSLIRLHGAYLNTGRMYDLDFYDSNFDGRSGDRLRNLIREVAKEFNIDTGLLATNALVESTAGRSIYLRQSTVGSPEVGLDSWYNPQAPRRIIRRVPQAERIKDRVVQNINETRHWSINPTSLASIRGRVHYTNEQNSDAGPVVAFENGREALRAIAAYTKFAEVRLTEIFDTSFTSLSIPERMVSIRAFYHGGVGKARTIIRRALSGNESIIKPHGTPGTSGREQVQRVATIRAAQAIHLSRSIFNENPCRTISNHRRGCTLERYSLSCLNLSPTANVCISNEYSQQCRYQINSGLLVSGIYNLNSYSQSEKKYPNICDFSNLTSVSSLLNYKSYKNGKLSFNPKNKAIIGIGLPIDEFGCRGAYFVGLGNWCLILKNDGSCNVPYHNNLMLGIASNILQNGEINIEFEINLKKEDIEFLSSQ